MKSLIIRVRNNIQASITKEMVALLIIALVIAGALFAGLYLSIHQLHLLRQRHVNYDKGRMDAILEIQKYTDILQQASEETFDAELTRIHDYLDGEVYVTLEDGTICSSGSAVYQIDLSKWKEKNAQIDEEDKFFAHYPFVRQGRIYYVLQNKDLIKSYTYTDEWMLLVSGTVAITVYFILVFAVISKKIAYIKRIGACVDQIKHGNLNTTIELEGKDELFRIADNMNEMQHNIASLIEKEKDESKKKYELITAMAHDIKTPVTIILGYLGIINQGKYNSDNECKDYLQKAYDKAEHLSKMMQTLFTFAKSGDQEIKQHQSYLLLDRMLRQVVSEYEPLAEEKNIKIELLIRDIKERYLDFHEVLTVIDNVMNNAIKYCKTNGLISIDLHQEINDVVFTVANSSEKINESELKRIFDEFYRCDKSRNSAVEGNGLGLYLVKTAIQKMNGTVWAEYKEGMFFLHIRLH